MLKKYKKTQSQSIANNEAINKDEKKALSKSLDNNISCDHSKPLT